MCGFFFFFFFFFWMHSYVTIIWFNLATHAYADAHEVIQQTINYIFYICKVWIPTIYNDAFYMQIFGRLHKAKIVIAIFNSFPIFIQLIASCLHNLTAWSTNMLSTCHSPMTKELTNNQCQLRPFVTGRQHALSRFVLEAVNILLCNHKFSDVVHVGMWSLSNWFTLCYEPLIKMITIQSFVRHIIILEQVCEQRRAPVTSGH